MSEKINSNLLNLHVKQVASTDAGKHVLWEILALCHISENAFTGDNNQTNHLTGKQSVGRDILVILEDADPTIYPNLILNNIEDNRHD